MQEINEILKKYEIRPRKYIREKNITFIETEKGKYVVKEKQENNKYILDYLKSRNFDYLPQTLNSEQDNYEITRYIESYSVPNEQKILDLIDLVCLLHNKTTHYKDVTEDDYKEIYEDINNNIEHLYGYYTDLITIIESKVYMSPCEYLIARNITMIFNAINFSKQELEKWYEIVKEKRKKRLVVIHNNLALDHFLANEKKYLISWNKSKIGIPVFDIYKLYIKHGLEYNFDEIFKRYEKNYPLTKDERKLFFILISLPQKITLEKNEYENTKEAGKMIDLIYKTKMFISPYYPNKRPEDNSHK